MKYVQTTINKVVRLEGTGIHCGENVRMEIRPAPAWTGRVFILGDARIPALARFAAPASRNTTLSAFGTAVHTVEHILSALSGLLIDNAEIELSAPEPPAMDGSAAPFTEALLNAGIIELDAQDDYFIVPQHVAVDNGADASAEAQPLNNYFIDFRIKYDHPLIKTQRLGIGLTPETYTQEIAPARTYGFIEEIEPLLKSGLAKGASFDNAVVIYPDRYSCGLRFDDEPVRHKVLDMVGDLALLGRRCLGYFTARESGHALNGALVRELLRTCAATKSTENGDTA